MGRLSTTLHHRHNRASASTTSLVFEMRRAQHNSCEHLKPAASYLAYWNRINQAGRMWNHVVDWFPMPPVPTWCMIIYAQFHFFISKFLFGKGQILDSHKNSTMILIWFKNEARQECPQVFGPWYFLIRVQPYQREATQKNTH